MGRKREPTPQEVLAEWVARAGLPTFYEQVVDEYLCTLGTDRRGPSRVALCTPCSPLAPPQRAYGYRVSRTLVGCTVASSLQTVSRVCALKLA